MQFFNHQIRSTHGTAWGGRIILALFIATGVLACSGMNFNSPPHVTVAEIIAMSKSGEPDAVIIDKIRNSGTVYRLSASQLADLLKQGVSDAVINYMQQTYLEAIRRNQQLNDQSYWTLYGDGYLYGGYPFGWHNDWYPSEPYIPYQPSEAQPDRPRDQPDKQVGKPSE